MATTLDVIFVGSMYLNSADRCGVTQLTNCAVTIEAGGTTYAGAFGDADTRDWRSTGTCFIAELAATNTVYATQRPGGGQDCVEETGWRYGIFSVHLVVPTA